MKNSVSIDTTSFFPHSNEVQKCFHDIKALVSGFNPNNLREQIALNQSNLVEAHHNFNVSLFEQMKIQLGVNLSAPFTMVTDQNEYEEHKDRFSAFKYVFCFYTEIKSNYFLSEKKCFNISFRFNELKESKSDYYNAVHLDYIYSLDDNNNVTFHSCDFGFSSSGYKIKELNSNIDAVDDLLFMKRISFETMECINYALLHLPFIQSNLAKSTLIIDELNNKYNSLCRQVSAAKRDLGNSAKTLFTDVFRTVFNYDSAKEQITRLLNREIHEITLSQINFYADPDASYMEASLNNIILKVNKAGRLVLKTYLSQNNVECDKCLDRFSSDALQQNEFKHLIEQLYMPIPALPEKGLKIRIV